MAQCVKVTQNPDGSLVLYPDSQQDASLCEYVLQTGSEAGNSLTSLTPQQGTEISLAIAGVWATAWAIRQVAKVLNMKGSENETD